MEWIVFIVIFIILIPITLYAILKPTIDNKKSTSGIINYDAFSRNYVFKVKCDKETILQSLSKKNLYNKIDSSFNAESQILTLSQYGIAKIDYNIIIREEADGCIIRVKQTPIIYTRTTIPFHVNRFFIANLNAEPIPYFEEK